MTDLVAILKRVKRSADVPEATKANATSIVAAANRHRDEIERISHPCTDALLASLDAADRAESEAEWSSAIDAAAKDAYAALDVLREALRMEAAL